MGDLTPPKHSLSHYLGNRDLLQDILAQTAKDLSVRVEDLDGPDIDIIKDNLIAVLREMQESHRLQGALYRIDLDANPSMDLEDLCNAILNREFKKVWFRKWHSIYGDR